MTTVFWTTHTATTGKFQRVSAVHWMEDPGWDFTLCGRELPFELRYVTTIEFDAPNLYGAKICARCAREKERREHGSI